MQTFHTSKEVVKDLGDGCNWTTQYITFIVHDSEGKYYWADFYNHGVTDSVSDAIAMIQADGNYEVIKLDSPIIVTLKREVDYFENEGWKVAEYWCLPS